MKKVQLSENYGHPQQKAKMAMSSPRRVRENFSMKDKKSWLWIALIVLALILAGIVIYSVMKKRGSSSKIAMPVPMAYGKQKFGFRFY